MKKHNDIPIKFYNKNFLMRFYIGRKVTLINCIDKSGYLHGVKDSEYGILRRPDRDTIAYPLKNMKPHLRPLTDIKYEERKRLADMNPSWAAPGLYGKETVEHNIDVEHVPFLLKQGFDVFNMIGHGDAIDITKLRKKKKHVRKNTRRD